MKLQDCLVVVIEENDAFFMTILERVKKELDPGIVCCVHAPIKSNTLVTTNAMYEVLTSSELEYVVVARTSECKREDIEAGIEKFSKERNQSQKPLLQRKICMTDFEWCGEYNLGAAIVIATRNDLFDSLKHFS